MTETHYKAFWFVFKLCLFKRLWFVLVIVSFCAGTTVFKNDIFFHNKLNA